MKTCGEVFRIFRIWVELGWIGKQLPNDSHDLKKNIPQNTFALSFLTHIFLRPTEDFKDNMRVRQKNKYSILE